MRAVGFLLLGIGTLGHGRTNIFRPDAVSVELGGRALSRHAASRIEDLTGPECQNNSGSIIDPLQPGSQQNIKNVVREFNKRDEGAIGTAFMTKYANSIPRSSMLLFRRKDVPLGIAKNHIRNIEDFNANFKKNPSNAVKMYMEAEIFIGKLTRVSDNDSRCYALMEAVLAAFSFSLTHNDDFSRAYWEHGFSLAQVLNISEQKKLSVYIGCDNHELLSTLWKVHAKNPTSFGDSNDCSEREFKVYKNAYEMRGSNSLPFPAVAFLNLMNDPATASHGVSLPPSSEDTSRGGELDPKNYKEL